MHKKYKFYIDYPVIASYIHSLSAYALIKIIP